MLPPTAAAAAAQRSKCTWPGCVNQSQPEVTLMSDDCVMDTLERQLKQSIEE